MAKPSITRVQLSPEGAVHKVGPGGKRTPLKAGRTNWKRLATMSEREVEDAANADTENAPLTDAQLKTMRPLKRPITIRVDVDVWNWFRNRGGKYQTQMNTALREYMNASRKKKRTSTPAG